uniref:Uncharacterized protein n=1 Tax=Peronospora matthiolae TaxID=2874970 RepID=A0AAV1US05_9STRA
MNMDETSDGSTESTRSRDLTAAGMSTEVLTKEGAGRLREIGVAHATAIVAEATVEQRLFTLQEKIIRFTMTPCFDRGPRMNGPCNGAP